MPQKPVGAYRAVDLTRAAFSVCGLSRRPTGVRGRPGGASLDCGCAAPESATRAVPWAAHTAVSIMSSNGVPIQEISDTVGHKSTHVTETVYRHVIVPAIRGGATVMDSVFGDENEESA
jgi:hypothetical protein